jgi:hypothetical protein
MNKLSTAAICTFLVVIGPSAPAVEPRSVPRAEFVRTFEEIFARNCAKHRETVRTSADHVAVTQARIGVSANCACLPKAVERWAKRPEAPSFVSTDDFKSVLEPMATTCAGRAARSVFVEECQYPGYRPPAGVHDVQRYCRCVSGAFDSMTDEEFGVAAVAAARKEKERREAGQHDAAPPEKFGGEFGKAETSCVAEQAAPR